MSRAVWALAVAAHAGPDSSGPTDWLLALSIPAIPALALVIKYLRGRRRS